MNDRRISWLVCAAVLSALLASCGVSSESQPKTIASDDVPFDLSQRAPSTAASGPSSGPYSYELFFIAGDRLHAVTRAAANPPSVRTTLQALLRGPTAIEVEQGLRSVLDPRLGIGRVKVRDGVATVTLEGTGATRIATDEQATGIAQLVYTATGILGVDRVRFQVAGAPAEIPRGDGSLSDHPLTRSDFPDVGP